MDEGAEADSEVCDCELDEDCYLCAPDDQLCWYCGGDGWGIVGTDWDGNWERGEFDGDTMTCPNCHGSGKAEDCTFW